MATPKSGYDAFVSNAKRLKDNEIKSILEINVTNFIKIYETNKNNPSNINKCNIKLDIAIDKLCYSTPTEIISLIENEINNFLFVTEQWPRNKVKVVNNNQKSIDILLLLDDSDFGPNKANEPNVSHNRPAYYFTS